MCLINSLIGSLIGIYGTFFTAQRAGLMFSPDPDWFYGFIFHRYMLLFGDILPSLDRCLVKQSKQTLRR